MASTQEDAGERKPRRPRSAEELRIVTVGDAGAFANREFAHRSEGRASPAVARRHQPAGARQDVAPADRGRSRRHRLRRAGEAEPGAQQSPSARRSSATSSTSFWASARSSRLLKDPTITDILINGYSQVFVERYGVLEHTNVRFKDERHLIRIIQKIVSAVGRRIDESAPMVDARLADGSRVNAIVPASGASTARPCRSANSPGSRSAWIAWSRSGASPHRSPKCSRRWSRRGGTC